MNRNGSRRRNTATLSPEARALLQSTKATRVPLPLTRSLIRAIRRRAARTTAIELARAEALTSTSWTTSEHGGISVVEVLPRQRAAGDGYVIFVHGGAFALGQALDPLAVLMAHELEVPVLSIEYRLAPEHPFPAALDDCIAAYSSIVSSRPGHAALMGVSAGGGLVLSMMQRLRNESTRQPAALALLTPWCDLTGSGDSYRSNESRDPVIAWRNQLDKASRAYIAGSSAQDPLVSPAYAEWDYSLPPSIITTGTRDLFLSDCVRLDRSLRHAGARSTLRIWEGMWHAFLEEPDLPEAREARSEVVAFLRTAWDTARAEDHDPHTHAPVTP